MSRSRFEGIIVIGAPRSGTTLLRRLLDAHPNIACPGETFLLRASARFLKSEKIADGVDYGVLGGLAFCGFDQAEVLERLREFVFGFHREHARREGKPRWAEKTAVDSFYLDSIERIFGDHAYFVCLLRHGGDVAASFEEWCKATQKYVEEIHEYVKRFPQPFQAFAHAWVDLTSAIRGFADRHRENAFLCRYEDLVNDPETTMKAIIEFVGEEWDPTLINRGLHQVGTIGMSDWKTYGKIDITDESIGRWQQLPDTVIHQIARIMNSSLESFGYQPLPAGDEWSDKEAARQYELMLTYKALKAGAQM